LAREEEYIAERLPGPRFWMRELGLGQSDLNNQSNYRQRYLPQFTCKRKLVALDEKDKSRGIVKWRGGVALIRCLGHGYRLGVCGKSVGAEVMRIGGIDGMEELS